MDVMYSRLAVMYHDPPGLSHPLQLARCQFWIIRMQVPTVKLAYCALYLSCYVRQVHSWRSYHFWWLLSFFNLMDLLYMLATSWSKPAAFNPIAHSSRLDTASTCGTSTA